MPLDADIATHVYLAILTDTGSFHFSHITPRTFEIAARCVAAGADPEWIARTHYDSNSMARVRLFGTVLSGMTVDPSGRIAVLAITPAMAAAAGGNYDDTEGLINFPLSVQEVRGGGVPQGDRDAGRLAGQPALQGRDRRRRHRPGPRRRRASQRRRLRCARARSTTCAASSSTRSSAAVAATP